MALVKRLINVKFQLGTGSFGESGNDTIEVTGLRVMASIAKSGGDSMTQLDMRVFGLPLDVMNKLTILGKPLIYGRKNIVIVSAGDDDAGVAVVFAGTIMEAWVDAKGAPAVSLVLRAMTGGLEALKPTQPTSFKGTVDAATVVASIAQQNGHGIENSGVSVQISNPYLAGTMLQQLQTIARAGNFNCVIEDPDGRAPYVAIWPVNGVRGGLVPLLSPDTGLVGYPMRTENGIALTTLFNPTITFGGQVQVKSSVTPANGGWTVFNIVHDLESELPDGKWFTMLECSILGQTVAIG